MTFYLPTPSFQLHFPMSLFIFDCCCFFCFFRRKRPCLSMSSYVYVSHNPTLFSAFSYPYLCFPFCPLDSLLYFVALPLPFVLELDPFLICHSPRNRKKKISRALSRCFCPCLPGNNPANCVNLAAVI